MASYIWLKLGDVDNYIEPFFGGGSVLLGRPSWHNPKRETVNDLNHYLINFWRAIKYNPALLAWHVYGPACTADIDAFYNYLYNLDLSRVRRDPEFFDVKAAAYWILGMSGTIGSEFTSLGGDDAPNPMRRDGEQRQIGILGSGQGVFRNDYRTLGDIERYFIELQDRISGVRIFARDWKSVLTPAVIGQGNIGIFLDPPYEMEGRDKLYAHDDGDNVALEVAEWAVANSNYAIVYAGYMSSKLNDIFPDSWERKGWRAQGGFANTNLKKDNLNRERETLWLSPPISGLDSLF